MVEPQEDDGAEAETVIGQEEAQPATPAALAAGPFADAPAFPEGVDAWWNVTDDRVYLDFGQRIPDECWKFLREKLHMSWFPARKWNVAKWSPTLEDFVTQHLGAELVYQEDEDDSASRAARFEKYAEHAGQRAQAAKKAVDDIAEHIPFGQPILVGHHSEKHARKDAERIGSGMRRMIEEQGKAEYWADRAKATEHWAAYKERPEVIARRVKKLESERRVHEREMDRRTTKYWRPPYVYDQATGQQVYDPPAVEESWNRYWARHRRWLEHYDIVLAFQKARYADSGGTEIDKAKWSLEPGGMALVRGRWEKIVKVNRTTVALASGLYAGLTLKYGKEEIKEYKPPEPGSAPAVLPLVNDPAAASWTMTSAEWAKISRDYKAISTRGAIRIRTAMRGKGLENVYLSDKPVVKKPGAKVEPPAPPAEPKMDALL